MGGEFTYPKMVPLVLNHGHVSPLKFWPLFTRSLLPSLSRAGPPALRARQPEALLSESRHPGAEKSGEIAVGQNQWDPILVGR